MKINNVEIMILKIGEEKENKNKEIYRMVDFAVIEGGDQFSIMVKDKDLLKKFAPFSKQVVTLDLTSTKYGIALKIV